MGLWKFQFHLNETKSLASCSRVELRHVIRSANIVVDSLANEGTHSEDCVLCLTFACSAGGDTMLAYPCQVLICLLPLLYRVLFLLLE